MIICQLLHTLRVGGAEVLAARLGRQLRDAARFVFVCLDEMGTLGEELRSEGFPVWVLGRRPGFDWRCAYRLAGILRREQVDLLHAHQYAPFFYGVAARLLYRRPAILFTEHGRHHPDYPRRKRMVANRLLLERRDRVVAVGAAVRQALINNEGIPEERVGVIYNGIDLSPYAGAGHDSAEVRRELDVGPNGLLIIQVARLDYLKDHATALRALRQVVSRRADAHLVVVGEGPERDKIEKLISEYDLSSHVHLLGLRGDVPRLLAAADVFLLTSISEGIPLTIIEALAAEVPVVATNVGGVSEIVRDRETGLLAPAGDAAALAECILELASNTALRRQMALLGRERAHTVFSESQMHAGYVRLYEEMLGAKLEAELQTCP